MLGTPSTLMQMKINFQIMNKLKFLDLIARFIDELKRYPIDANHISLIGF
jgi:hypothetical protein